MLFCVHTYSAHKSPRLPAPTTASDGTERYARLQQPAISKIYENSPAAATVATVAAATHIVDNDGNEIPRLSSAYETLQLPPTTSNDTVTYARLQRPAMHAVPENITDATTAIDATDADAGVDNDGYEIPIPTEVAPSPPHA